MRSFIKGTITGFLLGAAVFAAPATADSIDALFNQVRININGVDQIQWGEDIELDNGTTTPSSILYNGTTYLPMRKLGELSGNKIYWNGDSKTVSMTGAQKDVEVLAEKPDKNGNVWKYYTFKDSSDKSYLGVKDEVRGYERVYLMAGSSIHVTEDEIYFVRSYNYENPFYGSGTALIKLEFANDIGSQDGEKIQALKETYGDKEITANVIRDGVIFDGDYIYYLCRIQSNAGSIDQINAYKYYRRKNAI